MMLSRLISQSTASKTTYSVRGTSTLTHKSILLTFSKRMRCARISSPTRCRSCRPSTNSSSTKKIFTEPNFSMVSRLKHKSAQQRASATARQLTAHGVPSTIRHLESSLTMDRGLLAISGTILRTPLVMIPWLTVLADSRALVLVTTLTSIPSVTSP